jgi:hypothetical protein
MKNQQFLSKYLKQDLILSLLCLYVFKIFVFSLGAPFPTNDLASLSMVRPLLSWTYLRGWQRAETWRRAAPRQVAPWAQWGKKNRRIGQCMKLPASSIGHT